MCVCTCSGCSHLPPDFSFLSSARANVEGVAATFAASLCSRLTYTQNWLLQDRNTTALADSDVLHAGMLVHDVSARFSEIYGFDTTRTFQKQSSFASLARLQ